MSIEITDGMQSSRWGTHNTRLAACLLVYGYQLCPDQPSMRIATAQRPGQISTSIQFQDQHPLPTVTTDPVQWWDVAWRYWDDFRNKTGRYAVEVPEWHEPLILMRRALEARQWLAKQAADRALSSHPVSSRAYVTSDWVLAACLISLRLHLYGLDPAGRLVFDGVIAAPLVRDYAEDGKQCAIQWTKRAIVQQQILVAAIKAPANTPNLLLKHNDRTAFVPENMPPSVREPLIRQLYS